ncbi:MAG TPA: hypothetical protein VGR98_06770 [Streptosporangiaceae bacterium]|nr:hypothetical protein [Streptosporangiaceae bacterium]
MTTGLDRQPLTRTQVTLACFSIDGKLGSVLDRNVELTLIVPGPASAAAP